MMSGGNARTGEGRSSGYTYKSLSERMTAGQKNIMIQRFGNNKAKNNLKNK